jgi:group I intron endonuclease
MIIYSIYKVVNRVNGKVYIGFTNNFTVRKQNHINSSKNKRTLLQKAICKYGVENFEWEIIYQSKDRDFTLKQMEAHFIEEYNSKMPHGYNICKGGGGGYLSDYGKQKMLTENPMFNSTACEKVSIFQKNLWKNNYKEQYSKYITPERNKKISESKKGSKNINYGKIGCWDHINKEKHTCIHCGIKSTKGNIVRWHNEKCKQYNK